MLAFCVDKLSKAATGREADLRSDNEKMLDSGLNTGAHVAADASKAAANAGQQVDAMATNVGQTVSNTASQGFAKVKNWFN